MPPRIAPSRGQGQPQRAAGRGVRGRGGAIRDGKQTGDMSIPAHITTVGVRRPGFGKAGRVVPVLVNAFETTIPDEYIYHYDVAISPDTLPIRFNMTLMKRLQETVAPEIFITKPVYDGRKNIYVTKELSLGTTHAAEFIVTATDGSNKPGGRPPKTYKIKITKVASINPELLHRFIAAQQSQDNVVLTAIMALNVAIRMEPNQRYPFNSRSFFTPDGKRNIGSGLEIWRGYFQSVRPTIDRMIVNVDISTAVMYRSGQLIDLCLEFIGKNEVSLLSTRHGFPDRERLRLQRFLTNLRITTSHSGKERAHAIKGLTKPGANQQFFSMREGSQISVADYFKLHVNRQLKFPDIVCVEVGSGAILPLELCVVLPGQLMKKQVPKEKTKDVVEFSTLKPHERLANVRKGLEILAYGQSEYIRQFGMSVKTTEGPLSIKSRVINTPALKYGQGSKQLTITPKNGSWNMVDKKFFKPAEIGIWIVVIFADKRRFREDSARDLVGGFVNGAKSVGMNMKDTNPMVKWANGQGDIGLQLRAAGAECAKEKKSPPQLIVVVLPDNGDEIYVAVKHFGDITMGVATQCLKAGKCARAKMQYWANVMLKVNVKLGGINLVPVSDSVPAISDPSEPTIIIGADVIHPAPGAEGRPSFTALVASVDTMASKYVATSRVQVGRQELIDDMQSMCKYSLEKYMGYRRNVEKQSMAAPKRLIFFRDGVSEGQFQQVLDNELPLIKNACAELSISPKITLIVVGKRHHIRFFPKDPSTSDHSGNCPAGTVVDEGIGHPTEFDYYLQSHGGLLGTSRPSHYSVLYDESKFSADAIQSLSFSLCHVYARSTRSVSIPAPVYYADIVCARAKTHYDPRMGNALSDSATQTDASGELEMYKTSFRPLNRLQESRMYFM